ALPRPGVCRLGRLVALVVVRVELAEAGRVGARVQVTHATSATLHDAVERLVGLGGGGDEEFFVAGAAQGTDDIFPGNASAGRNPAGGRGHPYVPLLCVP